MDISASNLNTLRRLRRVWYDLFESDADMLDLSSDVHVLDREVRLEFDALPPLFVTWGWGQLDVAYCMTVSSESSFTPPPQVAIDASSSPIWEPLIGAMIEIEFLDESHQVLQIRCGRDCCYISSHDAGGWERDTVCVSRQWPNRLI